MCVWFGVHGLARCTTPVPQPSPPVDARGGPDEAQQQGVVREAEAADETPGAEVSEVSPAI